MIYEPRVYTAGKMDWDEGVNEGYGSEDSRWRRSVEVECDQVPIRFLNPRDTPFDHGGDVVAGCVAADMALIKESDGVLAYFNSPRQLGTVVEVVNAATMGKRVLAVFDPALVEIYGPSGPPVRTDSGSQASQSLEMRTQSPEYWFVYNFLAGEKDTPIMYPAGDDPFRLDERRERFWMNQCNTQVHVAEKDDIPGLLSDWVRSEFGGGA